MILRECSRAVQYRITSRRESEQVDQKQQSKQSRRASTDYRSLDAVSFEKGLHFKFCDEIETT